MRIEKKKEIVKDLHEKFLKSKVVIVTDYKGLDVTTISDLRRKLGAEKIEYKVVKNSLLIRASEETDVALIKDYFKGPSAVALSYDESFWGNSFRSPTALLPVLSGSLMPFRYSFYMYFRPSRNKRKPAD